VLWSGEMTSLSIMINLCGAVALLLFGLSQVKDGVSRAFGARLRTGLAKGTQSGVRSFFSGLAATIALQSSTATALMVASFVERELIRPRMAQIVLLGANVGTAITAWIFSTGIEWLSPIVILSGMMFYRSGSIVRQGLGAALVGVGLMLLSLYLLSTATEPMRHSAELVAFIGLLDNAWPVALALTAGIAFLSSSSLAAVVLILSLSGSGDLSISLIIVLVLGANLGGAIPPLIASLSGPASAKRVTLGNLIVRAIGCAIAVPLASYGGYVLEMLPLSAAKLPVDAHLGFNLILAALAWPFSSLLSRWMLQLVPEDPHTDHAPKYLDQGELSTPVVALTNAARETLGVGDLIERMLMRVSDAFETNDLSQLKEVTKLESQVDHLQQEVKIYLSTLAREGLSEENSQRSVSIIGYAINLEHIGDIVERSLLPQVNKKATLGLKLSPEGYSELKTLFDLTIDNLRIAQTIFVTRNFHLARQLMEMKVEVRQMEKHSAERHLLRLRDGRADSLQTSSLHLDMLRDLKRINAHIVSVAHPIMEESGLLIESRLLDAS
jgi:phosphate:Na+ symporter